MEINVHNRLLILNAIPKEGDILTVRVVKDLSDKIGLSSDEVTDWEVKTSPSGNITWNVDKIQNKEIEFNLSEKSIISDALRKLNKESKLTVEYLDVYKLFVDE